VTQTSGLGELAERGLARGIPAGSATAQVAEAIVAQLRSPFRPAAVTLPNWDECADRLLHLYDDVVATVRR
jgi:hypothetical protein